MKHYSIGYYIDGINLKETAKLLCQTAPHLMDVNVANFFSFLLFTVIFFSAIIRQFLICTLTLHLLSAFTHTGVILCLWQLFLHQVKWLKITCIRMKDVYTGNPHSISPYTFNLVKMLQTSWTFSISSTKLHLIFCCSAFSERNKWYTDC